jgi:uncharacterized OB-fold protein
MWPVKGNKEELALYNEFQKKLYALRVSQGRCTRCGHESVKGRTMCVKHLEGNLRNKGRFFERRKQRDNP